MAAGESQYDASGHVGRIVFFDNAADPDQEINDAETQKALIDQNKARIAGLKNRSRTNEQMQRLSDEAQVAGATSEDERGQIVSNQDYRDSMTAAQKLDDSTFTAAGYHSEADKRNAVAQMRQMAAMRQFEQERQREQEDQQRSGAMETEGDVASKMDAGDVEGAKREKFMQGLQEKSDTAHKQAVGSASLAPMIPISLQAVQNVPVSALLDTGATVNVLP
ncbi:MAG: hypothetical protein JO353_03215, partial [Phycisphaerae bacterium]|nr:hypothetical protein [Phycisphaerae bacterium]